MPENFSDLTRVEGPFLVRGVLASTSACRTVPQPGAANQHLQGASMPQLASLSEPTGSPCELASQPQLHRTTVVMWLPQTASHRRA